MRCEDLRDKLSAYVDGELPETETEACDDHLATCGSCADLAAERRTERDRWRTALHVAAPADLRQEILAGQTPRKTIRFERKTFGRKSMWSAWAAAAVLAAIVIGQVISRQDDAQRTPGDPFGSPGAVAYIVDGEVIGAFTELEEEGLVLEGGFL